MACSPCYDRGGACATVSAQRRCNATFSSFLLSLSGGQQPVGPSRKAPLAQGAGGSFRGRGVQGG
eukprot:3090593-Alexandrium_andersonii.AAC.1